VDIIRDTKPQKKKKKLVWTSIIVGGVAILTLGIRQLPSAAPSVDGATVWRDTVARARSFPSRCAGSPR